jgi:hypothetical protein
MKLTWKSLALTALGAATVLACSAAPSDEAFDSSQDDLTAEEVIEGANWNGVETEVSDDDDQGTQAYGFEEGPLAAPDPLANLDEPLDVTACKTATGYKRGVKMTICVTTVDGKPVEVNTASAFLKMRTAAKKAGVTIKVVSGFRTMAEQRYLYKLYKQGKGNLAAPPGYSNHQSGHALDLNTASPGVYSWLSKHGAAYGFKRTVPSEKWHWERW